MYNDLLEKLAVKLGTTCETGICGWINYYTIFYINVYWNGCTVQVAY